VLFERTCREHGITAKLTAPYSPTTTGKALPRQRWPSDCFSARASIRADAGR
jgi:transposase InsO family protein